MADEITLKASEEAGTYIVTTSVEETYTEEWLDSQIATLQANIAAHEAKIAEYEVIKAKIAEVKGA